jgi:putative ABC transport system permease protein
VRPTRVSAFWQDVRYAGRSLRKAPGFTVVAAIVLALGIGANSAVFSLADAALLRPLPFDDPDRLTMLWEHSPRYAYNRVSPLNFLDWSEQNRAFSRMAAVSGGGRTLTGLGGAAERIPGQAVTAAFFDVLGVAPLAGRTFAAEDDTPKPTVVIIGEQFWRTHFGADPELVGRTIALDGQPFTVIGVMPERFQLLARADLWTLFPPRRSPEQRAPHYMQVVGRLKPGVSLEQARADMAEVAQRIAEAAPDTNKGWGVRHRRLRAADGVRERRQPAARAWAGADTRNRGARGARRQPNPHSPAAAD